MGLLERFRRKRAIKAYIKKLPRLLDRDYGGDGRYTHRQVQRAVERHNLPPAYTPYAVAMFSSREEFEEFQEETGDSSDYQTLRGEIADRHFEGETSFEAGAIEAEAAQLGGFEGGGPGGEGGPGGVGGGGDGGGGGGGGGGP